MLNREQRAERAGKLLSDELLKESLEVMRSTYVAALRGCTAKDDLGRYRYAVALDVIDGLERHLASVLNLGKLSPKEGQAFQTDTIAKRITRVF
jgi:hypothetical protein